MRKVGVDCEKVGVDWRSLEEFIGTDWVAAVLEATETGLGPDYAELEGLKGWLCVGCVGLNDGGREFEGYGVGVDD